MKNPITDLPVRSRAMLSLAINAALALGWNAAGATAPQVTNCNTSGAGSLAAAIADPMTADGDVIDLTGLKTVCSRITASDITIHRNVIIEGPGAKYLAVDGGNVARVFNHDGAGTLVISGMTIENGYYSGSQDPRGGCLVSAGSVSLVDSRVSHCTLKTTSSTKAKGGGVYTLGNLHLLRSTIDDNRVMGSDLASAEGGGVYVQGDLSALYSTIRTNTSTTGSSSTFGFGGAARVNRDVDIENTTISGNKADSVGAMVIWDSLSLAVFVDSTVSGNMGTMEYGGIWSGSPLTLANTTIAFNRSPSGDAGKGDGVHLNQASLTMTSTIIAGNSGQDGPNDLGGTGIAAMSTSNNVVVASSIALPMDTITDCPKLDVLADNGGPTLTHGLNPLSAAIDKGSAPMNLSIDQRLEPRVSGAHADIGAVEYEQSDQLERVFAGGFDGLCDQ